MLAAVLISGCLPGGVFCNLFAARPRKPSATPSRPRGAFFQPTILTDVTPDNPAFQTEFFGPVSMVFRVADEDEAVAVANASRYGLGGSVFSRDTAGWLVKVKVTAAGTYRPAAVPEDQDAFSRCVSSRVPVRAPASAPSAGTSRA